MFIREMYVKLAQNQILIELTRL